MSVATDARDLVNNHANYIFAAALGITLILIGLATWEQYQVGQAKKEKAKQVARVRALGLKALEDAENGDPPNLNLIKLLT